VCLPRVRVCERALVLVCVCELVDLVCLVWHMREQGKDCSKCSKQHIGR
jgi:hypothetical protein